jgi:hypothetical protein
MLKICIAITTIAVIAQISALLAIALRLRKTAEAVEEVLDEIKSKLRSTVTLSKALINDVTPKYRSIKDDGKVARALFHHRHADFRLASEKFADKVEMHRARIKDWVASSLERSQQVHGMGNFPLFDLQAQ